MLIVLINGSPNKNGNTAAMLRVAEQELQGHCETTTLHAAEIVSSLKQPFCTACSVDCKGKCYQGTSMAAALEVMRRADGIIMGSPVYFCTVSAQLKAFWDKLRPLRKERALVNVVGGALAVGGARFGGQETTLRAMHDMMLCQGMTVIGDGFVAEDAGHQGACAQRPAPEDQDGLKRVRILAKRVLEVAGATVILRQKSGSA
ncbi:MAG: flavodoxin family protein [Bacillota bacterium]|uniref:flavodoxin family protein n=1 Tax=Desulfurispora thermophila TaxID=265470 RepID=UPI00036B5F73|nr:NAD(P)H-dependent oxidoreductase [Desulfurispora thermophila]